MLARRCPHYGGTPAVGHDAAGLPTGRRVANDEFTEAACLEATRWGGKVISIRDERAQCRLSRLGVRRGIPQESISSVGPVDLVVLHGEPNWWTTSWQLAEVKLGMERARRTLPPIVVAHAGLPWGRRDCYEASHGVRADRRQPDRREGDQWERGGLEVLWILGLGGVPTVLDPAVVETPREAPSFLSRSRQRRPLVNFEGPKSHKERLRPPERLYELDDRLLTVHRGVVAGRVSRTCGRQQGTMLGRGNRLDEVDPVAGEA